MCSTLIAYPFAVSKKRRRASWVDALTCAAASALPTRTCWARDSATDAKRRWTSETPSSLLSPHPTRPLGTRFPSPYVQRGPALCRLQSQRSSSGCAGESSAIHLPSSRQQPSC
eukprot:5614076-Pleurochrysis_carterae.AAC.2